MAGKICKWQPHGDRDVTQVDTRNRSKRAYVCNVSAEEITSAERGNADEMGRAGDVRAAMCSDMLTSIFHATGEDHGIQEDPIRSAQGQ